MNPDTDTNNEVTRLRELLNRAIEIADNLKKYAQMPLTSDYPQIAVDSLMALKAVARLAPAPEEPTTEESSVVERVPEWRELGPDEIPQIGDQWYDGKLFGWVRIEYSTNKPASRFTWPFRTRRPLPKSEDLSDREATEKQPVKSGDLNEDLNTATDLTAWMRDEIEQLKKNQK